MTPPQFKTDNVELHLSNSLDWLEFNNCTVDAMNGADDIEREIQAAGYAFAENELPRGKMV